mgnify:CR=1 FL=1
MNEIDLKQILIDFPDCITNGAKLKAILLDTYPNASKAIINTLCLTIKNGIASTIFSQNDITDFDKNRWQKRLEYDYGITEKISSDTIKILLAAWQCRSIIISKARANIGESKSEIIQTELVKTKSNKDYVIINNILEKYCGTESNVTIPNGVEIIKTNAFSGCGRVLSIAIPVSVTTIQDWAFFNCNKLKTIFYLGTKQQWDTIKKGYGSLCYKIIYKA